MKITVVSLDNWGFNNYIVEALKAKGIETTSINFDDFKYQYPTVFHKVLNFFLKNVSKHNLKEIHLKHQLNKRIKKLPQQDKILVIKSDFLNESILRELKAKTNELVTFLNDSLSRCPKMKKNIDLFDQVFSFENKDCKNYGFKKINNFIYTEIDFSTNNSAKYEVFNISSIDKRKKSVVLFSNYFNLKNISYKIILYSTKPTDYFNNTKIDIIYKPYTILEMLDYLKQCKIVLDLQRPKQQGLSFRVFESLAYGKKLITINRDIVNYDFYKPENIHVIKDMNNISIPDSFFKTEAVKIDKNTLEKYHISEWVNSVFNLNNKQ
ncbi:hypothetical protein [Algibacter mikhailovii]|uniref:Uncharacterized protein n=1 Tax=Algibacter mikhailovii TaxID=425498 RepID=A0A918QZF4_9FLAO|nr:hypothetical protein [Algibacter mikhailovii]GGZ74373.1 hypothetical protein GCM10007028_09620 [Algibacter mikhailovii]